MTPADRHILLDTELQRLREASQRLFSGTPLHSSGAVTVSALAIEAGLPRHRLTSTTPT